MKTILLPTDFSDNSFNAIEYAIELYKDVDCRFLLVNAYYTPHAGTTILKTIDDVLLKAAEEGLRKMRDRISNKHYSAMFEMELRPVYGDVPMALKGVCEEEKVDMVVMGTKGAGGLKEVLMGSNTADVIKAVDCPVLAIPENLTFSPPSKIAFAADYRENHSSSVLDPLMDMANRFDSELVILHVEKEDGVLVDVDEAAEELHLHSDLKAVKHTFMYTKDDSVAEGIQDFVHDHNIDMLAMVSRKHPFFERLFQSSVTKRMAMHTDIPLLTLHDE